MSIAVFVDRIVYSSFNQTSLTNALVYTVATTGLYRVSICALIPGHDISTGQSSITWSVSLPTTDTQYNTQSPNIDVNVVAANIDAMASKSTLVYIKAGQVLSITTAYNVGAPPTPFNTFVCVEPIQNF